MKNALSIFVFCFLGSISQSSAQTTLWGWGFNAQCQIGDKSYTNPDVPELITDLTDCKKIACGYGQTIILKRDGTLWGAGDNSSGELGNPYLPRDMNPTQSYFTQINYDSDWGTIECGFYHSLALKKDSSLWGWGANYNGQLGLGDSSKHIQYIPAKIAVDRKWKKISCGYSSSLAIRSDGSLWGWGQNLTGNSCGDTLGDWRIPTQIGTDTNWTSIASGVNHSIALKSDGSLWTWGENTNGQLGDSSNISRYTPKEICKNATWTNIACGSDYSLAIMSNGSLWAWGSNQFGQLGDSTTIDRNYPVRVGSDKNWSTTNCGSAYSMAIKNDGALWAWGCNSEGNLGDSTTANRSYPMQVGFENNWESVECGVAHTMALRNSKTAVESDFICNQKLVILPNPCLGVLEIKRKNIDGAFSIEIYNSLGLLASVLDKSENYFGEYDRTFDIANLPSGSYRVIFRMKNNVLSQGFALTK